MFHSMKRIAAGSVGALAIVVPALMTSQPASAAPLQGAGSIATLQQGAVADVSYRRNRYWVPGAIAAGAALGVLGAAAAAPSYAAGCDPYYYNCGTYPADGYYSYYPAPAPYDYYGYYPSNSGRQNYDLYGSTDSRVSH